MKEKIYKYIAEQDSKVSSQDIMENLFCARGSYSIAMETILLTLVNKDNRFIRDESGLWSIKKDKTNISLDEIIFTLIEFEYFKIDTNKKIPFIIGILQFSTKNIIFEKYYSLTIPDFYPPAIKESIKQQSEKYTVSDLFSRKVHEVYSRISNSILMSFPQSHLSSVINNLFLSESGLEPDLQVIPLKYLIQKEFPEIKKSSIELLADSFSLIYNDPIDLKERLRLLYEISCLTIEKLKDNNINTKSDLVEFVQNLNSWVDFSAYNFSKNDILQLPSTPGIYLMKNAEGNIFYVGKSKNLKNRVESYFSNRYNIEDKNKTILSKIYDLEIEQTGSELEALLLENKYINLYKPEINVQINVHSISFHEYENKNVILFLPNLKKNKITLFLLKGVDKAISLSFDKGLKKTESLKLKISDFFKKESSLSHFSTEQIELIWRWFKTNHIQINCIDIEDQYNLNDIITLIKKYCKDDSLFTDKIYYQ